MDPAGRRRLRVLGVFLAILAVCVVLALVVGLTLALVIG